MSSQEIQKGCNCELYVAGVQRALGFDIPRHFRASDFAEDTPFLQPVDYMQDLVQTGDIVGFWRQGETNTKRIHLGIIRWNQEHHVTEVLHASKDRKKVVVSEIGELLLDPKYASIAFIKRATHWKYDLYQPHMLIALGLVHETKLRRGV